MNPLTWQNPGQLFVAQDIIKVKIYSVAELRLTRMNKQYASPSIAVIEVESNAMLLNISDDHVSLYRMMGDEGDLVKQEGGGTQSTSECSLWDETW